MIRRFFKNNRLMLAILALGPGWIIPRIAGTLAFLAKPSLIGLLSLLAWWVVIPLFWVLAMKLLALWRRRSVDLKGISLRARIALIKQR